MKPIIFDKSVSIRLVPSSPFAFDCTFHKPDHFTTGDNLWKPGVRWQTWNWKGMPIGIKFSDKGTVEKPLVEVVVYSENKLTSDFVDSLIEELKYLYNLDLDLNEFYTMFSDDKALGPIVKRWRGLRPGQPSNLYQYLMVGIVLQNATVRRSIQMFQVLLEKYGTQVEYDGKQLYCFWEPGKLVNVSEEELRALKVGYRARSIKKVDEYFREELINEANLRSKDVETQRKELLKLYGVGPATVWYILFDVFHHWDVFDHVSPWEQKIYTKLFFDKDPEDPVSTKKILKYINHYGKYKHLAVHYIWEDLWWKRKHEQIPWLEKLIRI